MPNPFDDIIPTPSEANPFDDIVPNPVSTVPGTLGRAAIRSTVPALGGMAGAGSALTLGAPAIAASGPFAPVTAGVLGLGGALLGGMGGSSAQDLVLEQLPKQQRESIAFRAFDPKQTQVDVQSHPVATLVGELAPQIIGMRPSAKTIGSAGRGISKLISRVPMAADEIASLANVGLGAGIGGGLEASRQVQQRKFDPGRLAVATAAGGTLTEPTMVGRKLGLPATAAPDTDASTLETTASTSKIGSTTEKLKTEFVDRFAPIQHLIDDFEAVSQRKVMPAENAYQAARLYAGIPGRIEVRAKEFGKIIQPVTNESDDLSRLLIAERNAELSAQGRGLAKGAQIKLRSGRVVTVDDMARLAAEFGPEKMQRLQKVAGEVTDYNNRVLLADLVDAGIISKESAAAAISQNQKYVPFAALESISDDLAQEGGTRFGRQSFQVARQDAFKRLEGGAKVLDDPLVANLERVFKLTTLAERNRVGQKVIAIGRTPDGRGLVRPLGKSQRPPQGFSEFTVFESGKPTKVAIPTPVADAMKGLTQQNIDFITRAASLGSQALRTGSTTFSMGFAVTNPIRDFQLAKLVSRQIGVPFNVRTWMRGWFDSLQLTKSSQATFNDFEHNLGSFGGFFRGGAGVGESRPANQALRRVAPTTGEKIAQATGNILNPTVWIKKVGETLEMAPRLAVYKQAIEKGMTPEDAAFAARNSTIDFSRMGSSMKIANMWVPFLNARLQGTINTFSAVRGNPLGASYVVSTMIGAPVVATWYWNNTQFPEVWKDIPQWEKDNNFVVIFGREQDKQGRYTQVFKLPKGDVGRVFGNPLENVLAYLQGKDAKNIETVGLQMLSDVSPIPFERNGKFAADRALGSITPPPVEAARILSDPEAKSRFTGFPVVPRRLQEVSPELRAKQQTSESLKRFARTPVGKKLGISPIQTEAAIGTAFGTAGRDLLALVDRVAFKQKGNRPAVIGSMSRRFAGAAGGSEEERWIERAIDLSQASKDESEIKRIEAEQVFKHLTELAGKDAERFRLMDEAEKRTPGITQRVRQLALDEQRGITQLDRIVSRLPTEKRVQFISERLAELRTDQERQALLQQFVEKRILTPAVRVALGKIHRGLVIPKVQAQPKTPAYLQRRSPKNTVNR